MRASFPRVTNPVRQFALLGMAGTAGLFLGLGFAMADDQTLTAEPDAALRICEAYGPGYQLVPGTGVCVKIDGWVQVDVTVESSGQTQAPAK